MNIVIVNHYAGHPDLGMEFRPYYLAREWKKLGHNVIVVGGSYSHLRSKQPMLRRSFSVEERSGITYVWIRTNHYTGNGLGRIFSMFLFVAGLYRYLPRMLKDFKADLVIASSTYPLDNFPVRLLATRNNALHCYEVHDLWPLSPMELGGYSRYHPFIAVMQWAENFAYRNCDLVVSMLPNTLSHMLQHGLRKEKFHYIPNGISVDEWTIGSLESNHCNFINDLQQRGRFVVGYAGGHALSNALDVLLRVAARAQRDGSNLAFVLVGDGTEKESLVSAAGRLGLDNVFFLPPVTKRDVGGVLSMCDVLYLGWHDNPLYRFGISPNKLMDYMMAGKPVVHSVNAANDPVAEAQCGFSVPAEDVDRILEALVRVSELGVAEREEMGRRGRDFVMTNHNYCALAGKFLQAVEKVRKKDLKK